MRNEKVINKNYFTHFQQTPKSAPKKKTPVAKVKITPS